MPRTVRPPHPAGRRQLAAFGERLRLARKRRKISTVLMAERAGISRDTLGRIEKGDPAVSLGIYLRVMRVVGLDDDLNLLASEDILGRKLQDIALDSSKRQR